MNSEPLSLTALAKVLGRAKSGLHELAKNGRIPRLPGKKYDLAAVQKALASNLEPSRAKRVHRANGEQRAVRVNKPSGKPIKTPRDAVEAVNIVRQILERENAYTGAIDFNAARTAELIVKTHRRFLENEERSKRLVDAEAIKNAIFSLARQDRDALLNWPSRIGAQLAAELGTDGVRTIIVLERFVRELLVEMSDETKRRQHIEAKIDAI